MRLAILWMAVLSASFLHAAEALATVLPGTAPSGGLVAVDTLRFDPAAVADSLEARTSGTRLEVEVENDWLRAPFGDGLLTDLEQWRSEGGNDRRFRLIADYNRVDRLHLGVAVQIQSTEPMLPRLGARIGYAFGRRRGLYGIQLEQPILPHDRVAVGVSMVRRTDHSELQQVEDVENSLALLFGRQDYRDYFEREGFGAYASWRIPDFSVASVHLRNDEYRTLPLDPRTRSFFQRDRDLRGNPAVDDGESHAWIVRLERLEHRTDRTHAGFYHWIDLERSGHGMGGDFHYTRLLADVRSVFRLSPATTFSMRLVGGHRSDGVLPVQKQFTVGGVDGLRAHSFSEYRGDQMLLGQAEYTLGLWRMRSQVFEGGLHAIAFVDVGRAWFHPDGGWDFGRQQLGADGGFGLSTSEDNVRLYFARNLQDPGSNVVVSLRLQRPF